MQIFEEEEKSLNQGAGISERNVHKQGLAQDDGMACKIK